MKHQNKAFKCLFGCTEASPASVNSFSKRIWGNNKNRLLLHTELFAEISISMWPWWLLCDWSYLSLSSCSVAGSTSTVQPRPSEARPCPKTHLFFGGGAIEHLAIGALFKIVTFFLGELLLCPLNPCKDEKEGTCVHLARELLIAAPLPASLRMEVGNVSSHNGHIAQTCCLSFHGDEGRREQNCNTLIVSFITYSLCLTTTRRCWLHVPRVPLIPEYVKLLCRPAPPSLLMAIQPYFSQVHLQPL